MNHLKSYKLFEDNQNFDYEEEHRYYKLVHQLNKLYDNIIIKHRSANRRIRFHNVLNRFYDIYYTMGSNIKDKHTIHIGVWDLKDKHYSLWEFNKIELYTISNVAPKEHSWEADLNEESFDTFVSKWYDIYDKL
jgi:hypothetical protein